MKAIPRLLANFVQYISIGNKGLCSTRIYIEIHYK